MKLDTKLSPSSRRFPPSRWKYFPQYPILEHPRSIFFHNCNKPCFIPIKKKYKIIIWYVINSIFSWQQNGRQRILTRMTTGIEVKLIFSISCHFMFSVFSPFLLALFDIAFGRVDRFSHPAIQKRKFKYGLSSYDVWHVWNSVNGNKRRQHKVTWTCPTEREVCLTTA